ncbi:MAG: galactokinase family protein [bacterium]
MTGVVERLRAAGMSERESNAKGALFARCAEALTHTGLPEPFACFVPGRIEVLGKHTDYAGGRSLLCAMERGFAVMATPRDDARVRVVDTQGGTVRELAFAPDARAERGDWSNYVATVIRSLTRNFPEARRGADIAFASDLPASSGMSSSSAMVIAMFLALDAVNDLTSGAAFQNVITSREALAGYLGAVENGRSYGPLVGDTGVGTLGGSQDQTAILCCRAGVLSQYAFCPVRAEGEIPVPSSLTFVVAYSGVAASKTSNALHQYNEAALAVSEILSEWNAANGRNDAALADAIASAPEAPSRIRALIGNSQSAAFTPQRLLDRLEQFVTESYEVIPLAVAAFARNDMIALGGLVARSQRGVETLLGNQVPETIGLVRLAREHGAHASSAFGAGFGGSVWALVPADRADAFTVEWRAAYGTEFPDAAQRSEFFATVPGPGAVRLTGPHVSHLLHGVLS